MPKSRLFSALISLLLFISAIAGCRSLNRPKAEWTKSTKIAGKAQRLAHISGIVLDDKFAYVTIGGTVADDNEGTSGLRKVALDSGEVTSLDDGKKSPQSETGGLASDESFVYWNAGGNILRIAKSGGKPEVVAAEQVGIGLDIAVDNERVYWANHGYYSAKTPNTPKPIYSVPKQGGKVEIAADAQDVPNSLAADDKSLYWVTQHGIMKQAKAGGPAQMLYQINSNEGIDQMSQDADNLYFGFRSAGKSRWALRKLSKQGGEPQTLVKTYSLKPVVVDDAYVYFFDENGMTSDLLCRVPKNGGEVVRLDEGYSSGVIAQSKTMVYFASLDDIYRLKK